MNSLAKSSFLGNLNLLEVYIQYNGPRLLACQNQANKVFIALWVDEEEDFDLWLYMLVSIDKLKSIRSGEISLHQAFANPETNYLYELTYLHDNSQWNTKRIPIDDLDKDCLPLENTFIQCDPKTLPHLISQKAIQNAIIKTREIVNIILEPLCDHPNEFPAFELGRILSTFQPLIHQLSIPSDRRSSGG
jgi:hypothetical protein